MSSIKTSPQLQSTARDEVFYAASNFGKRTKKRLSEIDQIITTFKNFGQL